MLGIVVMYMGYCAEKSSWTNPSIDFCINYDIVEYDLQSAGLSIIREFNLLPTVEISRLETLPKHDCNVAVGKLQRENPGFSRVFLDKFTAVREKFLKANNLTDDRIITVKKDAIFTIGKCRHTTFGKLTFAQKSLYSSYIRLTNNSNIELFYSDDRQLVVKGIGETSLSRHRLYLLDFLREVIGMIEIKNPKVKRYLRQFIDDYKSDKLDEGYYLEFNNLSQSINKIFNYQRVLIPLVQIAIKELEIC